MMLFTLSATVFYIRLWLSPSTGIPDSATLASSQGTVAWVKEVTYRRSRDHVRFRLKETAQEFIYSGDSDSMLFPQLYKALRRRTDWRDNW
jgi:hypothetical protein